MVMAKSYFANILLLYCPLILQLVEKVQQMGLGSRRFVPTTDSYEAGPGQDH